MKITNEILKKMGYLESKNIFVNPDYNSIAKSSPVNINDTRLLIDLKPNAFYCNNSRIFILFFENISDDDLISISKITWNAQIPLVFISYEDKVVVYNGRSLSDAEHKLIEIETLKEEDLNINSDFSYWKITSSDFWKDHKNNFRKPKVDEILLSNIQYVTQKLKETQSSKIAVKLVLRVIFIRYLIDRGVDIDYDGFSDNCEYSKESFLKILKSKDRLYNLFVHLKTKFNGNLFEVESEETLIDQESLALLDEFVSGTLIMENGQLSLFPLYDFNIIPVELISNIYERFLGDEKQKQDKAFYTPPYLVGYILDYALDLDFNTHNNCKVLDPSCGSGVFLVEILRRILESKCTQNVFGHRDIQNEELISIVSNSIFGIDKNEDAIDIAIFSLYLTMLDFKDPKTLEGFKFPNLKNSNFIAIDFFDDYVDSFFKEISFDFIVGNPPWGRIKNGKHNDYNKKNNYDNQNNEISRSFIYRAKDFSHTDTKCCFIVTSKLFYNKKGPAINFRKWLLKEAQLEKFIELAPVRKEIFSHACCPAVVVSFKYLALEKNEEHEFKHLSLKPNVFFELFKIIMLEKVDSKKIPQKLLLEDDWAWKVFVYGQIADYYIIKKLKKKYDDLETFAKNKKINHSTGIQDFYGNGLDCHSYLGMKVIDSKKGIESFFVNENYMSDFNKTKIHRPRTASNFSGPLVLLKKGANLSTYELKAAFFANNLLYKDAITGFFSDEENNDNLKIICGYLNSSFYAYMNLLLGSSLGIEREQVFSTEVLNYPIVADSNIIKLVDNLQQNRAEKHQKNLNLAQIDYDYEEKKKELNKLVLKTMKLSRNKYVDYVLKCQIPLLANRTSRLEKAKTQDYKNYILEFNKYFEGILSRNKEAFEVNCCENAVSNYSYVEFKIVKKSNSNDQINFISRDYDSLKNTFFGMAFAKINDKFGVVRDNIIFSNDSFCIIKTSEKRNWHPAIAKNDINEVISKIIESGRD